MLICFFHLSRKKKAVFEADEVICVEDLELETLKVDGGRTGRKRMPKTAAESGRFIRAAPVRDGERYYDIAPDATMRAALARPGSICAGNRISIEKEDLRKKVYTRPQKTLIVFVVDSSDSMGGDVSAWFRSGVKRRR